MKTVKENFPSIREEVTKDEAREIFKNDPLYKLGPVEGRISEDEGGSQRSTVKVVRTLPWPHVHQLVASNLPPS